MLLSLSLLCCSRYQEPSLKEGFMEIKKINFTPYFANNAAGEAAKALFYQKT